MFLPDTRIFQFEDLFGFVIGSSFWARCNWWNLVDSKLEFFDYFRILIDLFICFSQTFFFTSTVTLRELFHDVFYYPFFGHTNHSFDLLELICIFNKSYFDGIILQKVFMFNEKYYFYLEIWYILQYSRFQMQFFCLSRW